MEIKAKGSYLIFTLTVLPLRLTKSKLKIGFQSRFHILHFLMFLLYFISCKVYNKVVLMTRISGYLLL